MADLAAGRASRNGQVSLTALAVVLVVTGLVCAWAGHTDPPAPDGSHDPTLFGAVVARVRAGEAYYPAMGRELAAQGYPSGSPFNWRLPTLTRLQAALPTLRSSTFVLSAIGLAAVLIWLWSLRRIPPVALMLTALLLVTSLPLWPWFSPSSIALHDLWAGQLILLTLALWACGRVSLSWVAGMMALAIREHVVVLVAVMCVAAMIEGRRREAAAWLAGAVAFGIFEFWHAAQLKPFMPAAHVSPPGWLAFGGWCFVLLTTRVNVLLLLVSGWWLAVLLPFALLGLFLWRSAVGRRVAATVVAYLAVFSVVGRPDNWYWGLLVAPLLPLGAVGWLQAAGARLADSRRVHFEIPHR